MRAYSRASCLRTRLWALALPDRRVGLQTGYNCPIPHIDNRRFYACYTRAVWDCASGAGVGCIIGKVIALASFLDGAAQPRLGDQVEIEEESGECATESLDLAALYVRRAEQVHAQAKLMVNDDVRSVTERLATVWVAVAHRTLVRHALAMPAAEAAEPTDRPVAKG